MIRAVGVMLTATDVAAAAATDDDDDVVEALGFFGGLRYSCECEMRLWKTN